MFLCGKVSLICVCIVNKMFYFGPPCLELSFTFICFIITHYSYFYEMIYGTLCTHLCSPHILVSCLWNTYPKRAVSWTLNNPRLGSKITGLVKDVPFRVTMNGDLSSMNLILFRRTPVVK